MIPPSIPTSQAGIHRTVEATFGSNRSVVPVWTCGRANRTLALSTASTGRCPLCMEGARTGSARCSTLLVRLPGTPDTGLTERLPLRTFGPSDRTGHRMSDARPPISGRASVHAPASPSRACRAARVRFRSAARSRQRRHCVASAPLASTARDLSPQARHSPAASRSRRNSAILRREESIHALHRTPFQPDGRLVVQSAHRPSPWSRRRRSTLCSRWRS